MAYLYAWNSVHNRFHDLIQFLMDRTIETRFVCPVEKQHSKVREIGTSQTTI